MTALRTAIDRFVRDQQGSITVEFVLWVPLLVTWITFSLAAWHAMDNRADAAKAAYTISDIISREVNEISRSKMADMELLNEQLLPGAATGAKMRISLIQFRENNPDDSGDDEYVVGWTECFGDIAGLTDDSVPLNLIPTMSNLDTVILTETYVPYLALSTIISVLDQNTTQLNDSFTWRNYVVTRPRVVTKLGVADDTLNCGLETKELI